MLAKAYSFGLNGLDAYPVTIEVDVGKGLPSITIVGLPDNAIRESRERVRSAIRNAEFGFPHGRITINLAPADIKKEGPSFDLAIALGIMAANESIPPGTLRRYVVLGELSLSGQIKPVTGCLPVALAAASPEFDGLIVPHANASEAALAQRLPVFPFRHLQEVIHFLTDPGSQTPFENRGSLDNPPLAEIGIALKDVKGQAHAKRGLEVAAAGGHNVLLIGPPGSGKTMLARRFPSILPPLERREALDVTRIASVAGTLKAAGLVNERPFRSPHHSASHVALVGGGTDPRPGEVTLAHHGVLFLDEFPEFSRSALESLRQPMEDGHVTIARASKTLSFPATFTLLAAMNPCPCGYLTDRRRPCRCSSSDVQKYLTKVSGPLLDRIDIHLEMPALKTTDLMSAPAGESSADVRARVLAARARQVERFGESGPHANAHMTQRHMKTFCLLEKECQRLLREAVDSLGLSARAHDKILKVARTIADLSGSGEIRPEHLAEAIGYRTLDKSMI